MKETSEPRIDKLRAHLERGIAPESGAPDVRRELGMPATATDAEVARSLAQIVSAVRVASIGPSREPRMERSAPSTSGIALETDASFLGQLDVRSGPEVPNGGAERRRLVLGVDDLDDPRTLVCVLRAGSLRQRRAAARRLTELLREAESIEPADEVAREIADLREPSIEHELRALRAEIPGGARDVDDDPPLAPAIEPLSRAIDAFWDGETDDEPIAALPRDRRVLLLHRLRELPDGIVRHVAAVVEGEDGASSLAARRDVLTLCRHAADPRLAPALATLVVAGPAELRGDAAWALAEIDDPRVRPALRAAYGRSVDDREKIELGGALGAAGDLRARGFARSLLARDDRARRLAALRALEHLGDDADVDGLVEDLAGTTADDEEVWQIVRTLARLGDGRALSALGALYVRTRVAGLRAEIEDAESAIRARMEVRGEALGERVAVDRGEAAARTHDAPVGHRLRGVFDYVVGYVLLALGAVRAGVARLERAAERRPRWSTPWVVIAMTWSRRGEHAAALGAFRRALTADRGRLERNPIVVRALARAFLRRAEEIERDGRLDIARGLLGEALAFDLRRAPSTLRLELKRQHELLARRSTT